jgi:hypothetical protein
MRVGKQNAGERDRTVVPIPSRPESHRPELFSLIMSVINVSTVGATHPAIIRATYRRYVTSIIRVLAEIVIIIDRLHVLDAPYL